mmetsp:Transcript_10031/g.21891  ORF Transcript_10031/g.21891 Transcript_10031/m.21891 type:complete len:167 (-) Transcript_10031:38-538(-)
MIPRLFHVASLLLYVAVAVKAKKTPFKANITQGDAPYKGGSFIFEFRLDSNRFVTLKDPRMQNFKYGCGNDHSRCNCKIYESKILEMTGRGTSGTMTGLDFECVFTAVSPITGRTGDCTVRVEMPYWSSENYLHTSCEDNLFQIDRPTDIPSGKEVKSLTAEIFEV